MMHVAIPLVLLCALSACGQSKIFNRLSDPDGYWLPLTVDLRMDSSVTNAGLQYADACRQPQTLAIGDRVRDALKREIGAVFERIHVGPGASPRPIDGVVDVALGLMQVDLIIPRQATKSYPATVTLGATIDYMDQSGTVLYTKNLKTDVRGMVETDAQSCEVSGLGALANQAAATLAQGLKKHLGTSTKVREAARAQQEQRDATASSPASPPKGPTSLAGAPLGVMSADSAQPATLAFRVMLKDENQDQLLQSREPISLEVEISNTGAGMAKDVTLKLSGTPSLVEQFTRPDPVESLQPGETKRLTIRGTAPETDTGGQAELIVAVEAPGAVIRLPSQKKFQVALEPKKPVQDTAGDVDVDQIPERVSGYERQKAVGIAVGVGSFRNPDVPGVQFAARDAAVMAEYFQTVVGISPAQVRSATDDHALKEDLVEVFEEWLPERVAPGGVVFVFLAGRARVNPSTGGVSLIPYEAEPASPSRFFSLRRLYEALARLPIQRAVLLMDLTLTEPSSNGTQNEKAPSWDAVPTSLRGDKLVQVIGVNGRQETHQYEQGRHGLFTYFLLKGLGGAADRDDNGIVVVDELCEYVHEQVTHTATAQFQDAQEPTCVPPIGSKSKASQFSLARVK